MQHGHFAPRRPAKEELLMQSCRFASRAPHNRFAPHAVRSSPRPASHTHLLSLPIKYRSDFATTLKFTVSSTLLASALDTASVQEPEGALFLGTTAATTPDPTPPLPPPLGGLNDLAVSRIMRSWVREGGAERAPLRPLRPPSLVRPSLPAERRIRCGREGGEGKERGLTTRTKSRFWKV